eukprot:scaffold4783_cov122-Skeletonema_menzelii.AAC.1
MSAKRKLINSAASKANGRVERHAKEVHLKTIDEGVSSIDNMSCSSSHQHQHSVGLDLSEYLSQGITNNGVSQ